MTQELLTALTVITSKKPFCVSPSQPFISLVHTTSIVPLGGDGKGREKTCLRCEIKQRLWRRILRVEAKTYSLILIRLINIECE